MVNSWKILCVFGFWLFDAVVPNAEAICGSKCGANVYISRQLPAGHAQPNAFNRIYHRPRNAGPTLALGMNRTGLPTCTYAREPFAIADCATHIYHDIIVCWFCNPGLRGKTFTL